MSTPTTPTTTASAPPAINTPAPAVGMWDDERAHPWRAALLYGLTITLSLLATHCAAMGGAA